MSRARRLIVGLLPSFRGRLVAWRNRSMIANFKRREVEHIFGGKRLRVVLADPVGELWYDRNWLELPEIACLAKSRLKPGSVVLDIGAHQGVVAMMLAQHVGPGGLVIAVEANPHNVQIARENIRLNGSGNVEIVESAVSDYDGTISFNARLNGQIDDGTSRAGAVPTCCTTIDTLAGRHGAPDVIFLDIEGAEVRALAGATRALAGGPHLAIEVHAGCGLEQLGGSVAQLVTLLSVRGYDTFVRGERDAAYVPYNEADSRRDAKFHVLAHAHGRH